MPTPEKPRPTRRQITFDAACDLVERALAGDVRREMIAALARAKDGRTALGQLRAFMRADVWKAAGHEFDFERIVNDYDSRTRHDGFHVLRDWDGVADTINKDTIPVDVLTFVLNQQQDGTPPDPV